MFDGDVYSADNIAHVPRTLHEATVRFEQSDFARETFGEAATSHLVHFFRTEQQAYNKAVTDWERQRYFERI